MTEPAGLVAPIYILMRPAEYGDILFLDVRSSVQDAERVLGRCMEGRPEPPEYFLYFDDRGQPIDAVATSPTSISLRPSDAPADPELLWGNVGQALGNMDQYLEQNPDAEAIFGQEFEGFNAAVHRHRTDPTYPITPFSAVYGQYGFCCRLIRLCCRCQEPENKQST
jgi:hypothetical protein